MILLEQDDDEPRGLFTRLDNDCAEKIWELRMKDAGYDNSQSSHEPTITSRYTNHLLAFTERLFFCLLESGPAKAIDRC